MPITANSWPPGLPKSLDYPRLPVGSLAAGAATRYGERPAFLQGEQELSCAGLYRDACRFAHALHEAGVEPGDVVAVHLPNCLPYAVAYYGILLAGATFSPANPLLPDPALADQLADCGAVAVVTHGQGGVAAPLREGGFRRVVVTDQDTPLSGNQVRFADFHAGQPETPPEVDIDVDTHLAHIAYTGGTTGRSKGVRLTHRNVVVNVLQSCGWKAGTVPVIDANGDLTVEQTGSTQEWPERLGTGRLICLTPWFHAMGTIGALSVPLVTGLSTTLHQRLDPSFYLTEAARLRVTQIGGAPALFSALMKVPEFQTVDLSSVLLISSGAAPMAEETLNVLGRRFPNAVVCEGYGLTEMTMGAVTSPAFSSGTRKVGAVGIPGFDTEVKIAPADEQERSGRALPAGEAGEVCLRGPQMMQGYLNRPEETSATLVDGWLHTGDIGRLDDDGYLYIVDRKKDMLLYKGYNVYPRELEELLAAEPAVHTAAVVGRPDADVGELPVAFVVRAPGHNDAVEQQLIDSVNAQVLPYKRIRELRFVETIPVSAAGKILKRELRQLLD